MINKFINKISYTKLAGIKKLLLIEQNSSGFLVSAYLDNSPIYILSKNQNLNNYKIVFDFKVKDKFELKDLLSEFCNRYDFSDSKIIWLLSEYRHTITHINSELEDPEIWFLDNHSSFIPDNQNSEDFILTTSPFYKDEDITNFNVIVTRKSYLDEILNISSSLSNKLIAVIPQFVPDILFVDNQKYFIVKLINNKLHLIIKEEDASFISESFFLVNSNNLELLTSEVLDKVDIATKSLKSVNGNFNIILDFPENAEIIDAIKNKLTTTFSNSNVTNARYNQILLKSLEYNFHSKLNLLPMDIQNENLFTLDKEVTNRVIIALGGILIIVLMLLYFSESFIYSKTDENSSIISELKSEELLLKQKNDNVSSLKENLSLLYSLRNKGFLQSEVLLNISKIIQNNSQLLQFNISTGKSSSKKVNIIGITTNQKFIPEIISQMENTDLYKNVSLEYSTAVVKSKIPNVKIKGKEFIKFSIWGDLNDN